MNVMESLGYLLREPDWVREHVFFPGRKWRFDWANLKLKIAIEYEGGIWMASKSRHTSGTGYAGDVEKYNQAQCSGWRVFRFTSESSDLWIVGELQEEIRKANK